MTLSYLNTGSTLHEQPCEIESSGLNGLEVRDGLQSMSKLGWWQSFSFSLLGLVSREGVDRSIACPHFFSIVEELRKG